MSKPGLSNQTLFLIGERNEMHNKYLRAKSFLMGKMIKKKKIDPKLGRLSHMEKVKTSDKVCFPDKNW